MTAIAGAQISVDRSEVKESLSGELFARSEWPHIRVSIKDRDGSAAAFELSIRLASDLADHLAALVRGEDPDRFNWVEILHDKAAPVSE